MFAKPFSVQLKNGDICEFTCDHATLSVLSELVESDPIDYLSNGFKNFELSFFWKICWCFSYWYRRDSGRNYQYLEFLSQLPVSDSIIEIQKGISEITVASMPVPKKNLEESEEVKDSQ